MTDAQLINQTSGKVEYYTPGPIIEAARRAMGGINLDPSSSLEANRTVLATRIFTKEDNGLVHPWIADALWMNHPFGRAELPCEIGCLKKHVHHAIEHFGNDAWISKLCREFTLKRVLQACCITYACTSEAWFQPLLHYPQCFLCPRTSYILPSGTPMVGNTKGSVVTYMGPNLNLFADAFKLLGIVKVNIE